MLYEGGDTAKFTQQALWAFKATSANMQMPCGWFKWSLGNWRLFGNKAPNFVCSAGTMGGGHLMYVWIVRIKVRGCVNGQRGWQLNGLESPPTMTGANYRNTPLALAATALHWPPLWGQARPQDKGPTRLCIWPLPLCRVWRQWAHAL